MAVMRSPYQAVINKKAAAGDNAELWVIPGAGHGNYSQVAGEEYEARVMGFFKAALKSETE